MLSVSGRPGPPTHGASADQRWIYGEHQELHGLERIRDTFVLLGTAIQSEEPDEDEDSAEVF